MIVRGRDFADIYDLVGVRVLVDTVRDCYAVLGALHARWNPVPGRFKDYIAMPKFNMYQSLHTTVIGPGGKPVEIQIRTHEMHRRAEYGVAAHWKYKESRTARGPRGDGGASDMAWLRQLLDWQRETADPSEFLDSLRFEINAAEVYVFTPKGDVIALPSGSTPVDFAYAVHTEVGHRCMGARVNGRLVPLESSARQRRRRRDLHLEVGDRRARAATGCTFVKSPRARNKIRQWFSKERREEAIEHGKDADRQGDAQAEPADPAAAVARVAGRPGQRDALRRRVRAVRGDRRGAGLGAPASCSGWCSRSGGEDGAEEDLAEATTPTRAAAAADRRPRRRGQGRRRRLGEAGPVLHPGARATRSSASSPAAAGCRCTAPTAATSPSCAPSPSGSSTSSGRRAPGSVFLVQIQVEALDRSRLLSDVTRVLSDHHVNILSATVSTSRDRVAISRFTFEMADPAHLDHVLAAVRQVEGVFDVYRVTGRRTD